MKPTGNILLVKREESRFRRWASAYPAEMRSGEWECAYPDWSSIYTAVTDVLCREDTLAHLGDSGIESILYLIARDNECEVIAKALANKPDALTAFAHAALKTNDSDAKWQIARRLRNTQVPSHDAEALLLKFVEDDDEYVRRHALLALGDIKSSRTEDLAYKAWESGDEYQRIAALCALKACGSPLLPTFVAAAMEDGRQYLVLNAREMIDDGNEAI
jgi:HEAT repeat protein